MKTNNNCYSIDANVVLRYLLGDDPDLSLKAKRIIEDMEEGHISVFCDPIILAEVVWVLGHSYKLSKNLIEEGLEPILKCQNFYVPGKDRYLGALGLFAESNAHFGDACACAMALDECDGNLLSFDRKLSGIDGINRAESIE